MRRCYDAMMRTTLDIDDRVLAAARSKARHERVSIGRAVSDLALAGLSPSGGPEALATTRNGFPVFVSPRGHVLTDDLVARHRDDG